MVQVDALLPPKTLLILVLIIYPLVSRLYLLLLGKTGIDAFVDLQPREWSNCLTYVSILVPKLRGRLLLGVRIVRKLPVVPVLLV